MKKIILIVLLFSIYSFGQTNKILRQNDSTAQRTFSDLKYVDKTSTQTITGAKSFNNTVTINSSDGVGLELFNGGWALYSPNPPNAPIIANGSAGTIPAGSYYYKCTWVGDKIDAGASEEETVLGTISTVWVADGSHNALITKPNNTPSSNVTGWKVYRSGVNPVVSPSMAFYELSPVILLATTTYTDTATDNTSRGYATEISASLGTRIYSDGLVSGLLGTYSTSWGKYALQKNTTGYFNAAFGRGALGKNTTGYFNTALGGDALKENVDGSRNVAISVDALQYNISGNENIAIGNGALVLNLSNYNNAVGQGSLSNAVNAEFNTGFGHQTLLSSTQGQNTGLGAMAGYNLITGVQNTFVGFQSGYNVSQVTNLTNSMALGSNSYTTRSNQIVIGDLEITETLLRGTVGIGTLFNTPQVNLAVVGDTYLGGNVTGGIAFAPSVGNVKASLLSLTTPNTNTGSVLTLGGRYRASDSAQVSWGSIAGLKENSTDSNLDGFLAFYTAKTSLAANTERMRINSEGEILIGSSTDVGDYKLQVEGNQNNTGNLQIIGNSQITGSQRIEGQLGVGNLTIAPEVNFVIVGDSYFGGNVPGGIGWYPTVGDVSASFISLEAPDINSGSVITLGGRYRDVDSAQVSYGSIAGLKEDTTEGLGGFLAFYTANQDSARSVERMRIGSNGSVTIGEYTLPPTDGSVGYILKTDGSGGVTWSPDISTSGSGTFNPDGTTIDTTAGGLARVLPAKVTKWDSVTVLTAAVATKFNTSDTTAFNSKALTTAQLVYKLNKSDTTNFRTFSDLKYATTASFAIAPALLDDSLTVKMNRSEMTGYSTTAHTHIDFFDTLSYSINIPDTVIAGDNAMWKIPNNITITEIASFTNSGTVTFNIEERAETTPNSSGTDVIGSDLVADTDQQETSTFSNASIDRDDWLALVVASISGDPTLFGVTIKYIKAN